MKFIRLAAIVAGAFLTFACQTPPKLANDIRLIGFDQDISRGKNVGLVEGDDCSYGVLGKASFGSAKLRRAFDNARKGARTNVSDSVTKAFNGSSRGGGGGGVRYMNNVTIDSEYDNYFLFQKYCTVVSGKGSV
jgi:hypothetical protein